MCILLFLINCSLKLRATPRGAFYYLDMRETIIIAAAILLILIMALALAVNFRNAMISSALDCRSHPELFHCSGR